MLPTSIAGSIRIVPPFGRLVALDDRAHVDPLGLEVAAGLDPAQVLVGLVRAGDVAAAAAQRLVGGDRHLRADRPDEAGMGAEQVAHLGLLGLARDRRPSRSGA